MERTLLSIWFLLSFAVPCSAATAAASPRPAIVGYVFPRDEPIRPEAIAAEKLTHVNYAFAAVRSGRLAAAVSAASANLAALVTLRRRNPELRVLVSAGGWSGSKGFSDLALTAAGRRAFADSVVSYLRRHDLDGFDLDWEYPGLPGEGNKHRPADRVNFTALLAELRRALDAEGTARGRRLLLTIAAGASPEYLEHTDLAAAQQSLDLVNLMTYDFAVAEGGDRAAHHANLRSGTGAHSAEAAVKLSWPPACPRASSCSASRSTDGPGRASRACRTSGARAVRQHRASTRVSAPSPAFPATTAGSAAGTRRRRRRTC